VKVRQGLVILTIFALCLTLIPSSHAVSATNFTLDRSSYNPGDYGKATVSFINDRGVLIQITTVTLSFDYFYNDGRVYTQTFTTTSVNMNVSVGATSQPIAVTFNLPSTVATGYFRPTITVFFNTLNGGTFQGPEHDNTDAPTPLLIASTSIQTELYAVIAATILFGALAIYFAMRYENAKRLTSPPPTSQ
jgi:hypothetical protein